ncbi:MAG TPA: hypothetical protein VK897_02380 [Anaerolineales bacterium]|nr:hypothetical protein [Anaerolineales bacterium]
MNKKRIQSVLQDALEQETPSSQIRLWPSVRAHLVAGNHLVIPQGEKMNPFKRSRPVAFVTVTVLFLLAFALITPQGRALAQDVLQFFTRTESDTFYMEPSDLTFEETTPFHEICGISLASGNRCSVEQIRGMVDFEVKELGTIPEGMHFVGSTGGPDYVELKYDYADRRNGSLHVIVEAVGRPSGMGTWFVAKSAPVEQVQIGNLPGEYYTGILFQDDEGNVTWLPDDPQATLRWEDGSSTYTLTYYAPKYPLTKDDLVRLAESMTLEPVAK